MWGNEGGDYTSVTVKLIVLAAVVVLSACAPVVHDVNPCPDVSACEPIEAPTP